MLTKYFIQASLTEKCGQSIFGEQLKKQFWVFDFTQAKWGSTLIYFPALEYRGSSWIFCQECSFEEEEVSFLTIELVLMSGLSAHPTISWLSPEHFSKLGQAREIEPNWNCLKMPCSLCVISRPGKKETCFKDFFLLSRPLLWSRTRRGGLQSLFSIWA